MTNLWPDIVSAAASSNVPLAAARYIDMGISVLPVRGKEPAIKAWKPFTVRRATRDHLATWYYAGLLQGVGVICGRVSGNLVVVDLDGEDAINAFTMRWPDLLETYTVTSGSGKGAHIYLYAEETTPTTRVVGTAFGNIELRSDGAYVVAPPSIHPSGKPYTVANRAEIMRVGSLRPVVEWIKGLIAQKHGGTLPPPRNIEAIKADRYIRAAIRSECDRVRYARPGTRNDMLNLAAFRLARFVREGKVSRGEIEAELLSAAATLAQTDGEQTVIRTIKSGLDAGLVKYGVRS